jgi:hypothetical protein
MNFVNDYSLGLIREGRIDLAYRILKRAEGYCVVGRYSTSVKYRVTVLNHLGCCMRRFGKNKVALGYLASAFKISKSTNSSELIAMTCLNLCAVYRQLEDHKKVNLCEKSLEYAKRAQSEYSHLIINANPDDYDSKQAYEEDYRDKVRQLAICYHNLSVEEDHFANPEKSLEYAKKAYQLMKSKFGEQNNITKKFKANYYNKLNNEAPETASVLTMRPLSEKNKARRSESKLNVTRKLPEWKIKTNPYSGSNNSKFHDHCAPHPEYSQHSKKPVPKYNNLFKPPPQTRQPITVKVKPSVKHRIASAKPPVKPTEEKEMIPAEEKKPTRRELEYTNTLRELEELGVTSSDDSEEDRDARMEANRQKFSQAIGIEAVRKEKVTKAKEALDKELASQKDQSSKEKREKDRQKAKEAEAQREKEQKEAVVAEKRTDAATKNISQFLMSKTLIDKQQDTSRFS